MTASDATVRWNKKVTKSPKSAETSRRRRRIRTGNGDNVLVSLKELTYVKQIDRDGSAIEDVDRQVQGLPPDASPETQSKSHFHDKQKRQKSRTTVARSPTPRSNLSSFDLPPGSHTSPRNEALDFSNPGSPRVSYLAPDSPSSCPSPLPAQKKPSLAIEAGHKLFFWDPAMSCGELEARCNATVLEVYSPKSIQQSEKPLRLNTMHQLFLDNYVQIIEPYKMKEMRPLRDFRFYQGAVKEGSVPTIGSIMAANYNHALDRLEQKHGNLKCALADRFTETKRAAETSDKPTKKVGKRKSRKSKAVISSDDSDSDSDARPWHSRKTPTVKSEDEEDEMEFWESTQKKERDKENSQKR